MKKYWVFFLQTLNDFLVYRARFVFTTFFQFITPLTMIWVFTSLSGSQFAGMSKQNIISYYVFVSLLGLTMTSKVDDYVKLAIQQGDFGKYMLKPVAFWLISLITDLSRRIIRMSLSVPIFLLILFATRTNLAFQGNPFNLVIVISLSLVLTFVFSYSFGLLTFYFEELWGWQNLRDITVVLLSGVILPYQFFPDAMIKILKWSPFPYLVAWPLRIGFTGNFYFEIAVSLSWITIFLFLGNLLWKKGLKIYSALGLY